MYAMACPNSTTLTKPWANEEQLTRHWTNGILTRWTVILNLKSLTPDTARGGDDIVELGLLSCL